MIGEDTSHALGGAFGPARHHDAPALGLQRLKMIRGGLEDIEIAARPFGREIAALAAARIHAGLALRRLKRREVAHQLAVNLTRTGLPADRADSKAAVVYGVQAASAAGPAAAAGRPRPLTRADHQAVPPTIATARIDAAATAPALLVICTVRASRKSAATATAAVTIHQNDVP